MPNVTDIFMDAYPRIFFACHRRHIRDPRSRQTLSAHQASILDHLDADTPTHLHALAKHLGVTPSTMSLHIDRLQSAGFVHRRADTLDKRRTNLLLTSAGKRIKEQQKVLDPHLVAALLKRLSGEERITALRALQSLASAADELIASDTFKKHTRPETLDR